MTTLNLQEGKTIGRDDSQEAVRRDSKGKLSSAASVFGAVPSSPLGPAYDRGPDRTLDVALVMASDSESDRHQSV